jgi:hypothetical protein
MTFDPYDNPQPPEAYSHEGDKPEDQKDDDEQE